MQVRAHELAFEGKTLLVSIRIVVSSTLCEEAIPQNKQITARHCVPLPKTVAQQKSTLGFIIHYPVSNQNGANTRTKHACTKLLLAKQAAFQRA